MKFDRDFPWVAMVAWAILVGMIAAIFWLPGTLSQRAMIAVGAYLEVGCLWALAGAEYEGWDWAMVVGWVALIPWMVRDGVKF